MFKALPGRGRKTAELVACLHTTYLLEYVRLNGVALEPGLHLGEDFMFIEGRHRGP